jgi:two-component system chemotaxis response regulator CheY
MAELLIVDDSKIMRDMIVACLRPDPSLSFSHASSSSRCAASISSSST